MKKITLLISVFSALFLLVSCGGQFDDITDSYTENIDIIIDYALQDKICLDMGEYAQLNGIQLMDDGFYIGTYSYEEESHTVCQTLSFHTLEGTLQHETEVSMNLEALMDLDSASLNWFSAVSPAWYIDINNNIYIVCLLRHDTRQELGFLYKFASDGTLLNEARISGMPEAYRIAIDMAADDKGNFYLLTTSDEYENMKRTILFFNEEVKFQGIVSAEDGTPYDLTVGRDGYVYAAFQDNSHNNTLGRISADAGKITQTWKDFPGSDSSRLCADTSVTFLCSDSSSLWLYNMATNESTKLFSWLDQDMLADRVRWLHSDGEGNLTAIYMEYNPYSINLAYFVPADRLTDPETDNSSLVGNSVPPDEDDPGKVVLAVLWENHQLQQTVLRFNQSNPDYHVVIESLLDFGSGNLSGSEIKSAGDRLQMELATGNHSYDLVALTNLDLNSLSAVGVFEDLSTYLDRSDRVDREDIFETVLSAYTLNDTLICLPPTFSISCLMGKQSLLGDRTEWTLREIVDFAKEHPAARLFSSPNQSSVVSYTLSLGTDSFITLDGDTAVFDTQLCEDYLEMLKNNPDMTREKPAPVMLQEEDALLASVNIGNFDEVQLYRAYFDEAVTAIGYPTYNRADGLQIINWGITMDIAMCRSSAAKDGAWAFLEYYLAEEPIHYGLPSMKERFDERAEETLYNQWLRDPEGNLVLTKEGLPQLSSTGTYEIDEWVYHYTAVTEEDIEFVRELISRGGHVSTGWVESLYQIFEEESTPYLIGQKELEDVVDTMKRRMMIVYSEMYD